MEAPSNIKRYGLRAMFMIFVMLSSGAFSNAFEVLARPVKDSTHKTNQALKDGKWDPDAGLVAPMSKGATAEASSSTSNPGNALDRDTDTHWQSGACWPTGFISRPELNAVLNSCAEGKCEASSDGDLSGATDASSFSGAHIYPDDNQAWFNVYLTNPSAMHSVTFRVDGDSTITASYITLTDTVSFATVNSGEEYDYKRYRLPDTTIRGIRLTSGAHFMINELAVQSEPCFETLTADLGEEEEVGWIKTKHYSPDAVKESIISYSKDGNHWDTVAYLDPTTVSYVSTTLNESVMARYIRIRHRMKEEDYKKASVYELAVYNENGPYGSVPDPKPQSHSMAELMGINGIWGWGTNKYSDSLGEDKGPKLYSRVASHARNYHNMHWDIPDPDSVPDYENMPGSLNQWWLDWGREYSTWQKNGLGVQASIHFMKSVFPPEEWNKPYEAAYNYGYAFARHFGPTHGNGLVKAMEIGNEPWDYTAAFYQDILLGMAKGAKAADSSMMVLTGAFQADEGSDPGQPGGNYIGANLAEEAAPYLDAINFHTYSYSYDSAGNRIGVPPEHQKSTFNSTKNLIRFRNHNLPEAPIYVTEWGWDSRGAGEECAASECVSEEAQALYAVRGAFKLARLGVDRLFWFFYANSSTCNTLYCRSGLTSSGTDSTGFKLKKSFYAFESMLNLLGESHFDSVLREDKKAWIYRFADSSGSKKYLAAWRPVEASEGEIITIDQKVKGSPGQAYIISGDTSVADSVASPSAKGRKWTLNLSPEPLIVEISPLEYTWTGDSSALWSQPGNWSADTVPDKNTKVVVPAGTPYSPIVENPPANPAICKDLTLRESASLKIRPGKALTVNGNLSIAGGGDFATLLIEEDTLARGSLIVKDSIDGQVFVEKYFSGPDHHMISTNVKDAEEEEFSLADTLGVEVAGHEEDTHEWNEIPGSSATLKMGKGYAMWIQDSAMADITFRMKGVIQTEVLQIQLRRSGSNENKGWNLLGNPFTSALHWDAGAWASRTSKALYIWDKEYNGSGDYRTWSNGIGSLSEDIIPSGKAFFVKAMDSGIITLPKKNRLHYNSSSLSGPLDTIPYIRLQLTYKDKGNTVFIGFPSNGSDSLDIPGDVHKLYSGEDIPQLYASEQDIKLSTNVRPPLDGQGQSVPLHMDQIKEGSYNLTLYHREGVSEIPVMLEDMKTGAVHDFDKELTYEFKAQPGDEANRFLLHFNKLITGIEEARAGEKESIHIYSHSNSVYINHKKVSGICDSRMIRIYDLLGRPVIQQAIPSKSLVEIPLQNAGGYLMVEVIQCDEVFTEKVFVE